MVAIHETVKNGSIRNTIQTQPEKTTLAVRLQLREMSRTYTGAMGESTLEELTKFLIASFPEIGVTEIPEAFRLAASGKLEVTPAQMTAWHGQWTGMQLGSVLNAYLTYRRAIVAEAQKAESANMPALQSKSGKTKEEIQAERIKLVLSGGAFRSLSYTDYDLLVEKGIMNVSKADKNRLLVRAASSMQKQCNADLLSNDQRERDKARKMLAEIKNDCMSAETFEAVANKAKVLAVTEFVNQRLDEAENED